MDLMEHWADENAPSRHYWGLIKSDDPYLPRVLVCLAQDPRRYHSISDPGEIARLGRDIGTSAVLESLEIDDVHCIDHADSAGSQRKLGLLCVGINQNRSIKELTISNFSHNQWQIGQFLGPFLASGPSLESVCIMTGGGYTRSRENMRLLAAPLLERSGPLNELCFIECAVDDSMVAELVHGFIGSPHLAPKKLQLAGNEFGQIGCKSLAKLLRDPDCMMETLDIPDNFIDDIGAVYLRWALTSNNTLKALNLEGNHITISGWRAFAPMLCDVSSIDAICSSNHTIERLCSDESSDDSPPGDIQQYLELNRHSNKSLVARQKVLMNSCSEE